MKIIHFNVQLSEPYEHQAYGKEPGVMHTSSRNVELDVITTSAVRAIELAMEDHPQGVVHVVQRRGLSNLKVDPDVLEGWS